MIASSAFMQKRMDSPPFPEKKYKGKFSYPSAVRLLGRILFYDPILSADSTISCASCHSPFNAFAHTDHARSHGIRDSMGMRNAPALFNLSYHPYFMWDGAINHLEMQSLAPITHPGEMGESISHVLAKIRRQALYRHLFADAFSDTSLSIPKMLKAIGFFIAGLESNSSRYDSVSAGKTTYTEQERNGYFIFSRHCAQCHVPPLFSNFAFEVNGLPPDPTLRDFGRMKQTQLRRDSLRFKVPSLRNLDFSAPYMHDGRFKTLTEVINHYNTAREATTYVSKELKKNMALSSVQKTDLLSFLLCLNDRSFVFNPSHQYPKNELDSLKKSLGLSAK
jgi:cytochrome c peroxidase